MTEISTDPENIVPDIRRAIAEKAAVKRAELWQRMGFPVAKTHMLEAEYDRDYKGRIWFASQEIMEQGTLHLRIILCPNCIEDQQFGVKGTRFFMTLEDDVMTVFPCVGHFVCHHCAFEEWHPLKHDPRVNQAEAMAGQQMSAHSHNVQGLSAQAARQNALAQAQMINQMIPGMVSQQALGRALAQGLDPNLGPIWGMTDEEKQSLHRLYQQTQAKAAPPPPIVQSREEAEMLLKLAPVERRQAIIQKLRDLGKI